MIQSVEGIRVPIGVLVVYSMPIQVSGLLNEYKLWRSNSAIYLPLFSVCVFVCVCVGAGGGGANSFRQRFAPREGNFFL